MKEILSHLKGDKLIWAMVFLLALFSFMPVYSASTNLVYTIGAGSSTFGYLVKHLIHLAIGLLMMYFTHRIPYQKFRVISVLAIFVVVVLLTITLFQGTTIGGANASRWIYLPFVNIGFQPSSIASVVLLVYVAQYLASIKDSVVNFKESLLWLWAPVFVVTGLILPANLSTAALIFMMVCLLVFVGRYPIKYLLRIGLFCIAFGGLVLITAKAFPSLALSRVDTWISRIDRFTASEEDDVDLYQVENAQIAIATGSVFGLGPGKSVQKNFLPQSSSDFIYAIIVEEYGLLGGLAVLFVYMFLFFRFVRAAHKAPTVFGKLLVVGLGFYIIFQAMINMGVAVSLLPTTGQTLPLISSGGTSIWMTCISLGIIVSVTKKEEEIREEQRLKMEKEQALQDFIDKSLIDKQEEGIAEDENPLNVLRNK